MTTEKIRVLLLAGILIPVVYFGFLIVAPLIYPGFSYVTQYASEMGSAEARYPAVFNTGVMLCGLAGILASFGFFHAIRRLGGNSLLAALTGLTLFLFGIATFIAARFPLPDERHGAYGLGLAFQLAPLFLALALWRRRSLRGLCIFLLVIFAVMTFFLTLMMGGGGLVTRANIGLWQRGNALAGFPWLGIAAWRLRKELRSEVTAPA
jgi:glucans biosynthesis protein C